MRKVVIYLSLSFLFFGCMKSVELEIVESKCKDFRISNSNSDFIDPNCPGDISGNTLRVSFNFSGDVECLHSIHRKVVFYDENNNVLAPKTQDSVLVHTSNPTVSVFSGIATFDFTFDMPSNAVYDNIAYVTVNFYTQNEILNQSNKLAIVASLPCKSIPSPSTTDRTIDVKNTSLKVTLWDNAAEDGDIITIIINGTIVAENVTIYNTPKTFSFIIDASSANYISFYAVNEGTSSPNTASGSINDGYSNQSFDVGMNEGETISFQLVYNGL